MEAKNKKKLYDFDGMFDARLAKIIEENQGKYSEKQWEDLIPKLYQKFGDTVLSSIGTTPKLYYREMTDEQLAETLRAHLEEGVPVPDFLCSALEEKDCVSLLLPFLESGKEELAQYAVGIIGSDERAYGAYLRMIASADTEKELKDAVCDCIKENADPVKKELLSYYYEGTEREYMLEMLSRVRERDDIVYQVILDEFLMHLEEIPMHASYLAAYGDDRALPHLLEQIERDDINYIEFQELKYAIEKLGGEYTKPRDFTSDPYYAQVHTPAPDLFGNEKQS